MICFTIKKSISHWWSRKVNVVKLGRKSYRWILQLKLKFFEKATKIWQNIHLSFYITYLVTSKLRIEILSNCVAFSEYLNFTYISSCNTMRKKTIQNFLFFKWNLKNRLQCTAKMRYCSKNHRSLYVLVMELILIQNEKYLWSRCNIFFGQFQQM